MSSGEPRLIQEPSTLERLAARWGPGTRLGVDTESDAFYAYQERLCLVQIADTEGIYLVDPLATPLDALRRPFEDPEVEIVLHAGENDVRLLRSDAGIDLRGVFDTQAAALLVGLGQVGLATLAEQTLGVSLSKREQRSDWRRRPLRAAQLDYAAADVRHLLALRDHLSEALTEQGRWEEARRLFEQVARTRPVEKAFDPQGFYRIKGYGGLDPAGRAIVRELYLAREARARRINRPPFMVLGNEALLRVARERPRTPAALRKVKGIPARSRDRFGQAILAAVRRGLEASDPPPPRRPRGAPRRRQASDRILDALRRWRQERAAESGIPVQAIATARDLELIAESRPATVDALAALPGLGPRWVERWGEEVLAIVEKGGR